MHYSCLVSGCTVRVEDLTIGSTKNFDLNSSQLVKDERVTIEHSYPEFIHWLTLKILRLQWTKLLKPTSVQLDAYLI